MKFVMNDDDNIDNLISSEIKVLVSEQGSASNYSRLVTLLLIHQDQYYIILPCLGQKKDI